MGPIVTALTFGGTALAADAQKAVVLYQKGNAAFKAGDPGLARQHYLASLAEAETFTTMCNLARAEAELKLYTEAYEHVRMCLFLYPRDDEFEEVRRKIYEFREQVRVQISFEEAHPIDVKVDEEIDRRLEAEEAPKRSTVPEPEPSPAAAEAQPAPEEASSARLP